MLLSALPLVFFSFLPASVRAPVPDTGPLVHEVVLEATATEVWGVFSTGAGFTKLGPAQAEIDLRIGGRIRSHYDPAGTLGDEGTIENEILAFEPERMISFRIARAPKGFPFVEAAKSTWSVVTLTALDLRRTHLRIAMLGWNATEESQKMRRFFDSGNAWTLSKLASGFGAPAPDPARAPHADDPLAPIVLETVIEAPREEVWRAWTTAAGWKDFFGADARIGTRPGEPFEILFDSRAPEGERGSEGCAVLAILAGRMFSFSWNAPPKFARARAERTWVVVELEELSARATRVRLSHQGFAEQAARSAAGAEGEWPEVRGYFASAWPRVLEALRGRFAPAAAGSSAPAK